MASFDDITEASENNPSKATALANLREQVDNDESRGVIHMYEMAAYQAGAKVAEVCAATRVGYTRPTVEAIAGYAETYREMGASCGHHTSMSYAVMPLRVDFERAFDAVCADTGKFEFGNDPLVGFDALNASQLWRELKAQLATWEAGEHHPDCPGCGECSGTDDCPSEEAGSWCSCVLGVLGFEWI